MNKDFWHSSSVLVLGGGSWGTVLAGLASENVTDVRLWVRTEDQARAINSTRLNESYVPGYKIPSKVTAYSDLTRAFQTPLHAVIWALPSKACRGMARECARLFSGEEILLHATKGVEEGSLKRVSEVLAEELPCARIGVISGPNLALEVARGEPAATVVASAFREVVFAGKAIFESSKFRIYGGTDVVGVEWAGTLKNILAIASGALDALGLGWNSRAMLISRGLAEIVRFGLEMGGQKDTFLGLAGMGDLLATCSSNLSRNYRVGYRVAKGEPLEKILKELSTAEGIKTTENIFHFSKERGIRMPITETVYRLLQGDLHAADALGVLLQLSIDTDVAELS